MSKMTAANMVLEAKGTTKCKAITACTLIIILYSSRALYNLFAISQPLNKVISFGFGWINVSDQADYINLNEGMAYVSFGIVLFVWEFLPSFVVIFVFKVNRPDNTNECALGSIPHPRYSTTQRAYFFDNPRRYDSDDDISGTS